MATTRQLAAIMFTDIEGYTALMQQDEQKGIETRKRHRKVFNRITGKYKGKILQYYGDGTLSIFGSAIDAVECGIEMQLAFQKTPKVPVRVRDPYRGRCIFQGGNNRRWSKCCFPGRISGNFRCRFNFRKGI